MIFLLENETIALVRDALEFCDSVPIVEIAEEFMLEGIKSVAAASSAVSSTAEASLVVEPTPEPDKSSNEKEFIPEFTELERSHLNEQLRNVKSVYIV